MAQVRFLEEVISGSLVVSKKSKKILLKELFERGFKQFSTTGSKVVNAIDSMHTIPFGVTYDLCHGMSYDVRSFIHPSLLYSLFIY